MVLTKFLALIGFLLVARADDENVVKHYERDCPCTPSKLWLDIVLAIDTSAGMTEEGVTQRLGLQ
ncbi:hypothetical protein OESDEN_11499 [Oesophagostomum dentatum]|uniref:VWFA domain-containing protein n=1 Tax=Oesophagostomum dentatum TaxID=61180 RepID=A0A0B1SZY2_OESDE|nr:hypothetical protein OESDEN_11499 [Oesophagostomum dentatum]